MQHRGVDLGLQRLTFKSEWHLESTAGVLPTIVSRSKNLMKFLLVAIYVGIAIAVHVQWS